MINQQLVDFIKSQLSKGLNKETITRELLANEWTAKDIEEGFNSISTKIEFTQPSVINNISKENYYQKGLFNGRISRLNFFIGTLFSLIPIFLIMIIWGIISLVSSSSQKVFLSDTLGYAIPVLITLSLVYFVIFIFSLLFRRCHDINCSGLYSFLVFVPFISIFAFLYFLFKKGDINSNEYGNPYKNDRRLIDDIYNL